MTREQKKTLYKKINSLPANKSGLKQAWSLIKKNCKDNIQSFLICKGIIDKKFSFLNGIRAAKGQPPIKSNSSRKKKTSQGERNRKSKSSKYNGHDKIKVLNKWRDRKENRKKKKFMKPKNAYEEAIKDWYEDDPSFGD